MPEVKKTRESWLDACKGIAIVLVVMGHIIDGNMAKGVLSGQAWTIVYNVIYLFHMPLFFVLSGMALAMSKRKNLAGGGIESCLNLLILYLFWQILYNTLRGTFSSIVNKGSADNLLYELVFPSTLYWYLFALLIYYIVFYLLLNRCNEKGLIAVGIIAFVVSSFIPCLQEPLKLNGFIYKLLYHFFYFLFGYIIIVHKDEVFEKIRSQFLMPVFSVLSIILFIIFKDVTKNVPFAKVIFTLAIILGLLFIVLKLSNLKFNKAIAYLGRNSIYIYLVHNYITVALRALYIKMGFAVPSILYMIICLLVTLLVCSLIQLCCSRISILDVLFRPAKIFDKLAASKVHEGKKE